MARGGPNRGQGREPKLTIAQELWIEGYAAGLRRDAWTTRINSDAVSSATAAAGSAVPWPQIVQWKQYAEEKPEVRASVIKRVARDATKKFGVTVSTDMVKRVLRASRGDI